MLDTKTFHQIQLLFRKCIPKKESFGIGITSALHVSLFSMLSSVSSSIQLVVMICPRAGVLTTDSHLRTAHEHWLQQVHTEEVISWRDIISGKSFSCKHLTHIVDKNIQSIIPGGDPRPTTFRNAFSLPGSKHWLMCRPCPALRTHILNWNFKIWMQFYCRFPLFPSGSTCSRNECTTQMDIFGDHLLHCPHVSTRHW